jgi:transposase, IS5 family
MAHHYYQIITQYFLGISAYSNEAPFEASMLVYFRKRIGKNLLNKVNKKMVMREIKKKEAEEKSLSQEEEEGNQRNHREKLILDATCAPADIIYLVVSPQSCYLSNRPDEN